MPDCRNQGARSTADQARRHCFHDDQDQPRPRSPTGASTIAAQLAKPSWPIMHLWIAAADGRPEASTSGNSSVTVCMKVIH
ncbi:hypothetical protein D3C78_1754770 [compost metagenome]